MSEHNIQATNNNKMWRPSVQFLAPIADFSPVPKTQIQEMRCPLLAAAGTHAHITHHTSPLSQTHTDTQIKTNLFRFV